MTTHEDFSRKLEHDGPSNRNFAVSFSGIFFLFAVWPLIHHRPLRSGWALIAGIAFAAVGWLRPNLLSGPNRAWMGFGLFLSRLMTPLIMALVFFLIFTPMAWLMRLFGANLLHRRSDAAAPSYWVDREPPGPAPESMPLQF